MISFSFKNLGHALAVTAKAVRAFEIKVENALPKILASKGEVEAVTDVAVAASGHIELIPVANTVEDLAYAALGELGSLLSSGDAAAEKKLLDAGLDQNVVNAAKAFVAGSAQVVTLVKSQTK